MDMIFTHYEITDSGVTLTFTSPDPGPGRPSDYSVALTDAELASVGTNAQLRTLVTTKLQRKLQATGIATRLDPFIGQSITI